MSISFDRIAMLLHLREKLAGHPRLATLTAHVDALLANAEAEATHEELPEKKLTKAEEEAKKAAEEAAAEEAKRAEELKAAEAKSVEDQASQTAEAGARRQADMEARSRQADVVDRRV